MAFRFELLLYKVSGEEVYDKADEKDLIILGFIAFLDLPKCYSEYSPGVLEGYGITIKIITGDNEIITQKIAQEINLPVLVLNGCRYRKT